MSLTFYGIHVFKLAFISFRLIAGDDVLPFDSRQKQHPCPFCPSSFTRKYNLVRHLELHKEVKQIFACNSCHKHFSRKDSLKLHLKLSYACGGGMFSDA
ncbi:hypothetical protein CDAR_407581 [Caerostris darwini]|uniref:C2H2-type domain-containing protein n=1 Tax=Caerostris darwini TaxID=1538125 RepID=A0AAV4PZ75_9ARAC|nr:hypothetical protein CDAR_407581 [Caerostris darwini]